MDRVVRALFLTCLLFDRGALLRAEDETQPSVIVEKAIKALGGEDAMARLQAVTWKAEGTIHGPGVDLSITEEGAAQSAHQYRVDVTQEANGSRFSSLTVLNGDRGWLTSFGRTVDLPKDVRDRLIRERFAHRLVEAPVLLKDKQLTLAPLGEVRVGDRAAVGIRVSRATAPDIHLFFDKQTGLPVKREMHVQEAGQDVVNEYLYGEYREYEGLKRFTKMTWKKDGKIFAEQEWTEIKLLERLDESLFDKP